MLNGVKSIFKSVTFYGGFLSTIPALAQILNELIGSGELQAHYAAIVAAVGGIIAIVGRLIAKVRVTLSL